ncbi:FmdB family zinc ribbon protein [Candidatus Palauibacter sp.]|uniref:FmdB family zinc ribbon protein n=1 Tax=Candidatus Palauibacter sp. TaxID=3101350 RepID=UPI003CC56381
MPTYEYRCRGCRHAFERFQRMSDEPIRVCPSCGERRVERLISAGGGIVFKGPGFYATDYRRPESGDETKSGSEAPADAGDGASKSGAAGGDGSSKAEGGSADTKPRRDRGAAS